MSNHGRFTWYDLMTTDPAGAKAFYTELLGWGIKAMEGPMPYSMWTLADQPLGGVMTLPDEAREAGAPPHWLTYVGVDSVDATVQRVEELGGSVFVPGQDIPGTGRFAVLADPQGGAFSIYRDAQEADCDDSPAPVGRFSWHELMAEDMDAAWSFYSGLFGWAQGERHDMGELGDYQIFSCAEGTTPVGGIFQKTAEMPVGWLLYVRVEDVEATVSRLVELGGNVLNGPMEVPGGDTIAQCLDPQGGAFALHSTAA